MFTCLRCDTVLSERRINRLGLAWTCSSCHGRAMTLDLLRRTIPESLVDYLWQQTRTGRRPAERHCPGCQRPMIEVPIIPGEDRTVCLDVCTNCYFIWFDPLEFESLPKLKQKPSDLEGLSGEAKKALALARLEVLKQEQSTPDMAVIKDDVRWQIALDAISVLLDILITP